MKRIKIKELLNTTQREKSVLVKGWVRTRRDSKGGFSFLEINDGSCQANIQVIVEHSLKEFSEGTIIGSLTNPLGPADQEISSFEIKFIFFIA